MSLAQVREATSRFQVPRMLASNVDNAERAADSDNGLSAQVEHGFDLVLVKGAQKQRDLRDHPTLCSPGEAAHRPAAGSRRPVPHQAGHLCAPADQLVDQPGAQQAGGASDKDAVVAPGGHCQVFQGAPPAHNSSRTIFMAQTPPVLAAEQ